VDSSKEPKSTTSSWSSGAMAHCCPQEFHSKSTLHQLLIDPTGPTWQPVATFGRDHFFFFPPLLVNALYTQYSHFFLYLNPGSIALIIK
jgi:hypothetical protein